MDSANYAIFFQTSDEVEVRNVTIRGGDSSNPALLLIGDQLVLVSHNYQVNGGPGYARQLPLINRAMHLLSTNHFLHSDYQLTPFPLTNWPAFK